MPTMSEYVALTTPARKMLEKHIEPYREEHRLGVLAAEAKYKARMEKGITPKRYPNTNYWDRVGPQIDSYRWKWLEQDCRDTLEADLLELDKVFEEQSAPHVATFNAKVSTYFLREANDDSLS